MWSFNRHDLKITLTYLFQCSHLHPKDTVRQTLDRTRGAYTVRPDIFDQGDFTSSISPGKVVPWVRDNSSPCTQDSSRSLFLFRPFSILLVTPTASRLKLTSQSLRRLLPWESGLGSCTPTVLSSPTPSTCLGSVHTVLTSCRPVPSTYPGSVRAAATSCRPVPCPSLTSTAGVSRSGLWPKRKLFTVWNPSKTSLLLQWTWHKIVPAGRHWNSYVTWPCSDLCPSRKYSGHFVETSVDLGHWGPSPSL